MRVAAYISATIFTAAVMSRLIVQHPLISKLNSDVILFKAEVIPNRALTPGAIRQVAVRDVCVMAYEEVVKDVPAALRQRVFQEYGIANADAHNYERELRRV